MVATQAPQKMPGFWPGFFVVPVYMNRRCSFIMNGMKSLYASPLNQTENNSDYRNNQQDMD